MLDRYGYATHEVLNQPPPLADYDAYATDRTLRGIVRAFGVEWAEPKLSETGRTVGSAHVQLLARQANRHTPELRTHDRFGNRVDEIEFHPAWHELMGLAIGQETHSLGWTEKRPGAQVARAALAYLWNEGENGIMCPILMTYASIPTLRGDPDIAREWEPKVLSTRLRPAPDPRRRQDRRHGRHGDDREAGRLGSAPDAKHRRARRRRLAHRRAQMVLLGAAFATSSSRWRAPSAASPASSCRAGCRTAAATGS